MLRPTDQETINIEKIVTVPKRGGPAPPQEPHGEALRWIRGQSEGETWARNSTEVPVGRNRGGRVSRLRTG